jgi:hypothetical protein
MAQPIITKVIISEIPVENSPEKGPHSSHINYVADL